MDGVLLVVEGVKTDIRTVMMRERRRKDKDKTHALMMMMMMHACMHVRMSYRFNVPSESQPDLHKTKLHL